MRARRIIVGASLVGAGVLVSGCGGATPAAAPTTARSAQVVMTSASSGYAVWPSGVRWIVLGTTDGWRTVENRTPVAVPTDGGLVLAADPLNVSVGVLPHELLTVSPVLTSVSGGRTWTPSQLPTALLPLPHSLAVSSTARWAVLDDGATVVTQRLGDQRWRSSTSSSALGQSGRWRATGVSFPGGRAGFINGAGRRDGPLLFATTDGGRAWKPVRLSLDGVGTANAIQVCRVGDVWVAPVAVDAQLVVFTARNPLGPWTRGAALGTPTAPVVSCGPTLVWAAVADGEGDVIQVSTPGGPWTVTGRVDRHLTSLAVVSSDHAFAATGADARLLSLRRTSGLDVKPVPLPDWVATIGGPAMRN